MDNPNRSGIGMEDHEDLAQGFRLAFERLSYSEVPEQYPRFSNPGPAEEIQFPPSPPRPAYTTLTREQYGPIGDDPSCPEIIFNPFANDGFQRALMAPGIDYDAFFNNEGYFESQWQGPQTPSLHLNQEFPRIVVRYGYNDRNVPNPFMHPSINTILGGFWHEDENPDWYSPEYIRQQQMTPRGGFGSGGRNQRGRPRGYSSSPHRGGRGGYYRGGSGSGSGPRGVRSASFNDRFNNNGTGNNGYYTPTPSSSTRPGIAPDTRVNGPSANHFNSDRFNNYGNGNNSYYTPTPSSSTRPGIAPDTRARGASTSVFYDGRFNNSGYGNDSYYTPSPSSSNRTGITPSTRNTGTTAGLSNDRFNSNGNGNNGYYTPASSASTRAGTNADSRVNGATANFFNGSPVAHGNGTATNSLFNGSPAANGNGTTSTGFFLGSPFANSYNTAPSNYFNLLRDMDRTDTMTVAPTRSSSPSSARSSPSRPRSISSWAPRPEHSIPPCPNAPPPSATTSTTNVSPARSYSTMLNSSPFGVFRLLSPVQEESTPVSSAGLQPPPVYLDMAREDDNNVGLNGAADIFRPGERSSHYVLGF